MGFRATPAEHEAFVGLAPRPLDTTYASACGAPRPFIRPSAQWNQHAVDIALFGLTSYREAEAKLELGFSKLHAAVRDDFNRATPRSDAELLDWYRDTESYIWELSAYHRDQGFNYTGMCAGIVGRLTAAGIGTVLCLGDGIGDLTITLHRAGLKSTYHDLAGSKTADFAHLHFWARTGQEMASLLTEDWDPRIIASQRFDAVVSLDFLEHMPNVPAWTEAIKVTLRPGGFFCAQNAFGIGSEGSIPMHLKRNDRYEKEWDPLLAALGFQQESSNWYRKAA
jgi:hypothetical protein